MTNKILDGKVILLKMNYLTKYILFILIIFSNCILANDNKIIFQVNETIYTSIDLKNRIKYLEILNSTNYESELEIEIINDYFNSVVFFEYVKNNKFLNNILEKESELIFENIILNNNEFKNNLNVKTIKKNINLDFARKIVLENILDNYKEYIFSNPKDINFIYNYIIKYITVPINNILADNTFNEILSSQNFNELSIYIDEKKIDFHLEEVEIKDLNKINKKIKNLIYSKNKFQYEKDLDFYRIIKIDKILDINKGVFYRLINIETNNFLKNDQENCNYIKSLNNIKSSKENDLNKLNNKIKKNLISINDFIVFKENSLLNYIFLCEIRVDENFLKEININKKINFIAKDIELDFINKYSKLYDIKKFYE